MDKVLIEGYKAVRCSTPYTWIQEKKHGRHIRPDATGWAGEGE